MMLKNVELRILYTSPNIMRTIKQQRIGWAGHVARKRQKKICRCFSSKKYEKSALVRRRHR